MPLVAVNLSNAAIAGIRTLIDSGKYVSLESFMEVAAFNQLAMEKSGGEVAKGIDALAPATNEAKRVPGQKRRTSSARIQRQVYVLDAPGVVESFEPVVKPFARMAAKDCAATPVSVVGGDAGERIFGQVNRLLPLKLVCRWIMKRGQVSAQWPQLSDVSETLADDAARLGTLLEQQDAAKERKRDECLATGLPRRANGPSKDRFVSQFIARVTRSGHVFPGAVCQYKLAVIRGDSLALSPHGVQFASLQNPILDGRFGSSVSALESEEIDFLLRHVATCVPQEHADFAAVIDAIKAGASTPQSLAAALAAYLPKSWNDGEIQTHVSGLVARMSELSLVRRRWHGRHVQYALVDGQTPAQSREKSREAG